MKSNKEILNILNNEIDTFNKTNKGAICYTDFESQLTDEEISRVIFVEVVKK